MITQQLPEPNNSAAKEHLFISYSRENIAFVERLAVDLTNEGYPVWVDNISPELSRLRVGEPWQQALSNAINTASTVILILSPESRNSEWVKAEIRLADQLGKKVVPILYKPVPGIEVKSAFYNVRIGNGSLGDLHYLDIERFGYDSEFKKLCRDLKHYIVPQGIASYSRLYFRRPALLLFCHYRTFRPVAAPALCSRPTLDRPSQAALRTTHQT